MIDYGLKFILQAGVFVTLLVTSTDLYRKLKRERNKSFYTLEIKHRRPTCYIKYHIDNVDKKKLENLNKNYLLKFYDYKRNVFFSIKYDKIYGFSINKNVEKIDLNTKNNNM